MKLSESGVYVQTLAAIWEPPVYQIHSKIRALTYILCRGEETYAEETYVAEGLDVELIGRETA